MSKVGIIGFGNMGSAIAERIKAKYEVWVFDKDTHKTRGILAYNIARGNAELAGKVDTVILSVKPRDFSGVLREIQVQAKGKLVISIAAGIATGSIERLLGASRVVRVMPNVPVRIGQGTICMCSGKSAAEHDLRFAQRLFDYMGTSIEIEEGMMNAATAISGSGPAYFYDFIENNNIDYGHIPDNIKNDFADSLAAAARELSFDSELAWRLTNSTLKGTIALLEESGLTPGDLKRQITSKGGTTEAALEVLHRGGSLTEAVRAALKRANELSKEGAG